MLEKIFRLTQNQTSVRIRPIGHRLSIIRP